MLGRTNTGGGGSGGLNFQVIGGTTAPSNPKENMIWVNTSTKITSYIFSATQPTAASGMVWISTGTSSPIEFNALKKNGIQVYPTVAKQYVNSVWVDVSAYIYRNAEWVQFSYENYYLFKNGELYESRTGGWSRSGYTISNDFNNTDNSQVTIGDTIVCKALCPGKEDDKGGACGTANEIDITGFTTMRVKGKVSGYKSNAKLYVGVNTTKAITVSPTAKIELKADGDFEKTLKLPTSKTSLYIFVLAACYIGTNDAYTSTLTVNEISLE